MYYKASDIELETSTHRVTRAGVEVRLTPLEFAMLHYLMRHPNRLCTRAEIIEHVWGQRFHYDTGTLDVHLTALRRKLGFTRQSPIQTVRGVGLILRSDEAPDVHSLTIRPFIADWLQSHSGDFESKGLKPLMQLDPFVNDITMSPDDLRTMLDAILAALLPSARPGTVCVSSHLSLTHFSLILAINATVNELRIPIYGDSAAS